MKKTLLVLTALAMVAGVAQAILVVPATVNASDGWFDSAGGGGGGTLFTGPLGAANAERNGMAVFALPTIPVGATVSEATFTAYLYSVNLVAGMGTDLYARLATSTSYGAADFYNGAYAGTGVAAAGSTGIMDDFIHFLPEAPWQPPFGTYSTDVAADTALGALIDTAYSGGGAPSIPYLLIRLNHDMTPDPMNFQLARFRDGDGADIPTLMLTVPEPATIGLLGLAGLGAFIARRMRIS